VGRVGHEGALTSAGGGQSVEHVVEGDRQGADLVCGLRDNSRSSWSLPLIRAAPERSISTGRRVQPMTRQAMRAMITTSGG
jgi:hypothetical protein